MVTKNIFILYISYGRAGLEFLTKNFGQKKHPRMVPPHFLQICHIFFPRVLFSIPYRAVHDFVRTLQT